MTLTLELPQDLEQTLSAEAAQLGLSLPEYALRLLYSGHSKAKMPATGAELVAYWQEEDLIGTRNDIVDSQEYAAQLRAAAERRN